MGGLERIQFNVMLIRVMNIYYSGSNISHLIQSEIYITYKKNQNKRGGDGIYVKIENRLLKYIWEMRFGHLLLNSSRKIITTTRLYMQTLNNIY